MYRSVILGCGGRSHAHARAYELVEDAELVACCDMVQEKLQQFSAKYGIRGYSDPEEMIEKEKPDLIHLVTRPSTRVPQLKLVSDLGVPACIVEKPIAVGVDDWMELRRLADTTKTKIGVGAQFRYHPVMNRLRDVLKTGDLGEARYIEATAGSTVCDQGVHVLDWAMSLNGESPASNIFGACSGTGEVETKHPSPDNVEALIAFENGVHCLMALGEEAPRVHTVYDAPARFSHCRVAVTCEKGRVLFEEFGKWEILSPNGLDTGHNASREDWQAGNDQAQANLTRGMLSWLEGSAEPVGTNLDRALAQWNVILGLYASALYRMPQKLPFEPDSGLFGTLVEALDRDSKK